MRGNTKNVLLISRSAPEICEDFVELLQRVRNDEVQGSGSGQVAEDADTASLVPR